MTTSDNDAMLSGDKAELTRWRKKPVEIEAMQYGPHTAPSLALLLFLRSENGVSVDADGLLIHALEGDIRARPGDWIIRDAKGELYTCKPDIFAATYEPADSAPAGVDAARHWIDRYAAGIDDEPQMDRIVASIRALSPPQEVGEPSEAEVEAALKAYFGEDYPHHRAMSGAIVDEVYSGMRGALTAAAKARALAHPPGQPEVVSDAARDVLAERKRQIDAEGWTAAHDDQHKFEELACAAACYAAPPSVRNLPFDNGQNVLDRLWPWDRKWWKPGNRRRNLVKAGALILAEIERLDRAAALQSKEGER